MAFTLFAEPPEIDLDASMRKLVTVRAGCPIRLFAIVRGRPAPKVTWRRVGIDNVVRKGQVDLVDTMAFLVIPNSTRDDSGKYSLTLVNPAGEKAVFVNVRVLGGLLTSFLLPFKNALVNKEDEETCISDVVVPCRHSWACV